MAEARQNAYSPAADPDMGRARFEELSRRVMFLDAMRRLDQTVDAVATYISIAPGPRDYDDAVVVERRPRRTACDAELYNARSNHPPAKPGAFGM